MAASADKEPWHLDRKVPIALILTIIMQTAGAIWWAASLEARISRTEEMLLQQKDDPVRLARLEGFKDELLRRLDRWESKLDRLVEDRGK